VSSGSWNYNNFIRITNQNGDGSAITVNSVTGATDGLLVAGTDYYVGQNDDGEYGIFIIDSATVTTETQDITIDYDYTPNSSIGFHKDYGSFTAPYNVYKFKSCPRPISATQAVEDVHYLVKHVITSSLPRNYVDLAEEDFVGSDITL